MKKEVSKKLVSRLYFAKTRGSLGRRGLEPARLLPDFIFAIVAWLKSAANGFRKTTTRERVFQNVHKFFGAAFTVTVLGLNHHDQFRLISEAIQKHAGVTQFVLAKAHRGFFLFQGTSDGNLEVLESDLRASLTDRFEMDSRKLEDGTEEIRLLYRPQTP